MVKYDSHVNGECIFCKLARKEMKPLGDGLFYEDKKYMAWLSPFPNTPGFCVLIPKKHYVSDVLAMPDKELKEFVMVAKKISKILLAGFDDVGRIGLLMEGMGIDHAHIKLYPMHGTEHLKSGKWIQVNSNNNSFHEKYPGFICSNDGPKADFDELKKMAEKLNLLSKSN